MTNVDDALQAALQPVLPGKVYPTLYTKKELEYIATSHTTLPVVFADGKPGAARYLCTVRYYLPWKQNPNAKLLAIQEALFDQDFTWPSVTDISDDEGQAYALECEYANPGGAYGYS